MNDLREILDHLDPGSCSYTEWCEVGMALKYEGYTAEDWEAWSAKDRSRYHEGECLRKWETFHGSAEPVTGGTIYQLAIDHGWNPTAEIQSGFLDWDSEFIADGKIIDPGWVEDREVKQPDRWHPAKEVKRYLETLFEPNETVGLVVQSRMDDERKKYIPRNAGMSFTVSEILERLDTCGDDIGAAIGDYNKEAGAWVRFNPLDGKGGKNENVTEFRYALVESDTLAIEKQNALIRELQLPVAVLVYSGGKSLHAIVRIDASDYTEYRKRVNFLYKTCQKNGMSIDEQNKNPSRLSRLPGCVRGDQKQYIVDTNIGKRSWEEWQEYIESVNDALPDFENLADVWNDMPEKAPELIEGVLREGHKMLIVGGSKTGKSFLLIEMCISIAEGQRWLGWECRQGRVLYVNLELDRASCLNRFKDVYKALGLAPNNLKNIDVWNLRGESENMEKLVPKLVRRASKHSYKAIVIDPIYKVLTGDENSAEQMAKFCNQFDKVATQTKASVIYCHHHSKGAQGGKEAMDRASGSGVFGRDPDALLDLIELPLNGDQKRQVVRNAALDAGSTWLRENRRDVLACLPQAHDFNMPEDYYNAVRDEVREADWLSDFKRIMREREEEAEAYAGLRIDGTLREFRKFKAKEIWFKFPVHEVDETGMLSDIKPNDGKAKREKKNLNNEFDVMFDSLDDGSHQVEAEELAKSLDCTTKTISNRVKAQKDKYTLSEGIVFLKAKKTRGKKEKT